MRETEYYHLKQPERDIPNPDPADIEDLNDNADVIDAALKENKDSLAAHKSATTLDHPNGSVTTVKIADGAVTDAKVGNRSIGEVRGSLQTLFDAIGNNVKGVKGAEEWSDAPAVTLDAAKTQLDGLGGRLNIAESDIAALREHEDQRAHFKGYFATLAELEALGDATPNDFAYVVEVVEPSETSNKWIYDGGEWTDTGDPVPAGTIPASDATPLMDGQAAAGSATAYARGDHRHPADANRVGWADVTLSLGAAADKVPSEKAVADAITGAVTPDVIAGIVDTVKGEVLQAEYPVGALYFTTKSGDPAGWLGFGTWTAWGGGRVPVGVNTADADFGTAEKAGGAKTSAAASSGAGTSGSTAPTVPSSGAGTSGSTAISAAQMPAHKHEVRLDSTYRFGVNASGAGNGTTFYPTSVATTTTPGGVADTLNTGGGSGHTHTTPNHTHTVSGHTHTTPSHTHTAQSIVQPYITCYMWKRTG